MEPALVTAFAIAAISLVFTPGADWAYAISAGVRQPSYLAAVTGLTSGYVIHTAILTAGLAALVTAVPTLLDALTLIGACYLLWLGISTLRSAGAASVQLNEPASGGTGWRGFLRGLGTSTTNPKALLLFVALMPQFVSTAAPWPVTIQLLTLGAAYTALTFAVYTGVAAGARHILRARPRAARVVTYASGGIMVALAILLAAEQFIARFL